MENRSRWRAVAQFSVAVRLGIFVLMLLALWLPVALPIYLLWGTNNVPGAIALLILYLEFLGLAQWWGKIVHQQPHPLKGHGLALTRRNGRDLLWGLGIGSVSLTLLFALEGWLGWLTWQASSPSLPRTILEGGLVALGVGLAEELLFRGWLVDELCWNFRVNNAFWLSSILYAALHFIKPWEEILRTLPSFPGLLLLGLTLCWGRIRCRGRLGFSIGLHAGLVWIYYAVDVLDGIRYTSRTPIWVTGIDQNPLAGLVGVLFLSLIAAGIQSEHWGDRPS